MHCIHFFNTNRKDFFYLGILEFSKRGRKKNKKSKRRKKKKKKTEAASRKKKKVKKVKRVSDKNKRYIVFSNENIYLTSIFFIRMKD